MKKSKPKTNKISKEEMSNELDLSQGMGIFPEGIPFTQNIGCVGGKAKSKGKKPTADKK